MSTNCRNRRSISTVAYDCPARPEVANGAAIRAAPWRHKKNPQASPAGGSFSCARQPAVFPLSHRVHKNERRCPAGHVREPAILFVIEMTHGDLRPGLAGKHATAAAYAHSRYCFTLIFATYGSMTPTMLRLYSPLSVSKRFSSVPLSRSDPSNFSSSRIRGRMRSRV